LVLEENNRKQDGGISNKTSSKRAIIASGKKPNFHLLLTRKFEQSEMSEVFFGRYMKYAYLVVFCLYYIQWYVGWFHH